jgi:hypothetical protein
LSQFGADASINISVMTDTSALGTGLSQVEAQVAQSTAKVGKNVDDQMTRVANTIAGKMKAIVAGAFIVNIVDQSFKAAFEKLRAGGTFNEAGVAMGEGIEQGLRSVPIAGTFGAGIADAFLYGLDTVLDYIPQWVKDFDRELSSWRPGGWLGQILFPAMGGMLSGVEDMRTEARQGQSRQEAVEMQRREAQQRQIELQTRLFQAEQAMNAGMGTSPLQEQISRMAGSAVQGIDTATGTYRFATGGSPQEASRRLVAAANEQVRLLAEIKELQKQIADNEKLIN